jgi:hypothetical protein
MGEVMTAFARLRKGSTSLMGFRIDRDIGDLGRPEL